MASKGKTKKKAGRRGKRKRSAKGAAARRPSPAPKPRRKRAKAPLPRDRFDPRAYAKKKAAVLGLGRSGFHTARLLARKGFRVFVSDLRPRKDLRALAAELPPKVKWEAGKHSEKLLSCDFAVKSPGIPHSAPVLRRLREAGVPVFSEIEVALAFCPADEVVAVTGTNGKTTTASLTAAAFSAAKRRVHLAGNIGEALSASVGKVRKADTLVIEVSSYQLEDSRHFRPAAAAILNITRDHLDHHGDMSAYMDAKARIYRRQDRRHVCVFNAADPLTMGLARDCRSRKLFFSHDPSTRSSAWIEEGKIAVRLPGEKKASKIEPPKLPGAHNLDNAMAAALLALCRGVKPAAVSKGFKSFRGVEHRLEDCGRRGPLFCINDSKATNIDSTLVALRSLEDRAGGILLILGGLQKGGGFKALRPPIERLVKAVLAVGSAGPKIEEDLQGVAHVFPCATIEQAVSVAFQIGQKGETLLLSPACASFDQFRDFEERGRRFKDLVAKAGKAS
ncbi:MAG: UDP-N-acetylmuramoyl-L-alanine--D-glutamate ligase [Elusimicrobiota bacterium]